MSFKLLPQNLIYNLKSLTISQTGAEKVLLRGAYLSIPFLSTSIPAAVFATPEGS